MKRMNEAGVLPLLGPLLLLLTGGSMLLVTFAFFQRIFFATLMFVVAMFLIYVGLKLQDKVPASTEQIPARVFIPYFMAFILILVALGPALLIGSPPDFNTTTRRIATNGWDPPQTGFKDKTELLNGEFYISSIQLQGKSEEIVAVGGNTEGGGFNDVFGDFFQDYEYVMWFSDNSFSWPSTPTATSGKIHDPCEAFGTGRECGLGAWQFELIGPKIGWVRVTLYVNFHAWNAVYRKAVATDDAYIKPGDIANFRWQEPRYEVGDVATVEYSVGFASNPHTDDPNSAKGEGWTLTITCNGNPIKQETIDNPAINENRKIGTVSITVPANCFITAAPDGQCGENAVAAELFSTFWSHGVRKSTVVDQEALAPSADVSVTTPGKWEAGDVVTIKITGTPNPTTKLGIKDYHYVISPPVGESTQHTSNSSTYTFTIQSEGKWVVQGWASDLGCRGSEVKTIIILAQEGGGSKTEGDGLPWLLIAITVLMIIAVIILWVVDINILRDEGFPWKKVFVTLVVLALYFIVFWSELKGLVVV